nr:tyrosine-type recombinase/integrase [Methylococcus sp. Mc7]
MLIGSYYQAETDLLEGKPGHHLKIELSPHLLAACNSQAIQTELDSFAHGLMTAPEPAGVAIHLAVDVQGWSPDPHFQDRFITRARIARRYDGISDAEFDGLSDVSVCYGKQAAESLTFGKAASLQLCLYDKSKQIVHADKVDFMQGQWGEFTQGEFDPTQPVWRVEARFHHSARAGIENFRWHDLRHTWASWHVQGGTPLHVLQELGGWESVEMVKRYAHLSGEHLAQYVTSMTGGPCRVVTNRLRSEIKKG